VVKSVIMRAGAVALWVSYAGFGASGQATSGGLTVKAVAEVESRTSLDGREVVRLAPATRVAPGDEVIYTLEIRNTGTVTVRAPTVVYPVPAHMKMVADSATGPGTEVSFSIDGGHRFEPPDEHIPPRCIHSRAMDVQKQSQSQFRRIRTVSRHREVG
jgi:uncharacterized repeat protein (TIGR01451 family)